MIAIDELMIGNWVYDGDKTQFPMFVETIGPDYVYLNFPSNEGDVWDTTPEELQGIPLTPELLTKLGFTLSHGLWRKREHGRVVIVKPETKFAMVEAFNNQLMDSRGWSHEIKYLHDLQNFFKIISRKNLNFEP